MASSNPFVDFLNSTECNFEESKKVLETPLPAVEPQDLSGKVVIVTGANVGIGFETAKSLASMKPKKLILACRNAEKANEAVKAIQGATGLREVEAWALDLASFASVREFSAKFLATGQSLDILVSNAGLSVWDWMMTTDGFELTLQVNHIANSLLISLLHPALKKAAQQTHGAGHFPRVVVVSSNTHFWCNTPLPEDPHPVQTLQNRPANMGMFGIYPSTKLLNVLFAKAWAAKCPDPIWICSANPGYTESQIGLKDPVTGVVTGSQPASVLPQRPTYEGAKTIIDCAISPKVGPSGGYYSEMQESRTRSSVGGEGGKTFANNVWSDTFNLLKKVVPQNDVYNW